MGRSSLSKCARLPAPLLLLFLLPRSERCLASKSEQKRLILTNIFGDYSRDVPPHPQEDDSAVRIETRCQRSNLHV